MHDDISSKLNVILLNSNFLIDGELSSDEYTKVNQNIIKVTNKTLGNARKIAHDLYNTIGTPLIGDFKAILKMNVIANNSVTTDDINLAGKIWDPAL